MKLRPDPTFHATPQLAMQAAVENYAFTVMLSPDGKQSGHLGTQPKAFRV